MIFPLSFLLFLETEVKDFSCELIAPNPFNVTLFRVCEVELEH